ncbi:MAG: tagatose 1,6-diphosphate aldolase [Patescibacteria group bacterium]
MKLSTLQTKNNHFTISAFDHRSSLVKLLGLDETDEERLKQQMIEVKSLFMKIFSPISSGVLTDPIYGLDTLEDKAKSCGLLMSLEESGYDADKTELPKLLPNWGIKGIKEHGSSAKMLLYFNPKEKAAMLKKELIVQLYALAKKEDIPFLLELVLFPLEDEAEFKKDWHTLQLESVGIFQGLCDVLKIEYPGLHASSEEHASLFCEMISKATAVPWIILSRGMKYELFFQALKISMDKGAAGFAVGRAVWQEIDNYSLEKTGSWQESLTQMQDFLENIAVGRLEGLIELVEK